MSDLYDFESEAEHMESVFDEGFKEDMKWRRQFTNNRFSQRIKKNTCKEKALFLVIQNSRSDDTTLMLVDRRKSKEYWWTHDFSLAYKGSKEDMRKVANRLHRNNVRVVSYQEYLNN